MGKIGRKPKRSQKQSSKEQDILTDKTHSTKNITIRKKKKRTLIGRKLKNSQKTSVRQQDILNNETHYQSDSIQNSKENNGKNHGIETGHKMSGQFNASRQN